MQTMAPPEDATAERFARLDERFDRTDERIADVDRRVAEATKETNRRLDEVNRRITEASRDTDRRIEEVDRRITEKAAGTDRRITEGKEEANHRFDRVEGDVRELKKSVASIQESVVAMHTALTRIGFGVALTLVSVLLSRAF